MHINTCAPSTIFTPNTAICNGYTTAAQCLFDMQTWEWRVQIDELGEYISSLIKRWISKEDILLSIKWIYEYED